MLRKGFLIEPVDIITFGSPCQDLSIAGKRAGLNGAKSGLFWEAIRIIWEMLLATGGKYPRFVIWENVPGALSSNKGKDFEVVLNELLHLREFAGGRADQSILQHGKWGGFANYGAVAYRIVNAQWWGIPQRRRRVYSLRRKYADRLEKLLDCKIPIHRKINSNKLARDRRRARQCRCIYKKQHKALSLSVSQNTRPAEIMPWA